MGLLSDGGFNWCEIWSNLKGLIDLLQRISATLINEK